MYQVTLTMPIYNVENSIKRALLSALNQTFDSIEFLLVDDKGTDNSITVAKEIITSHPRGKDVKIIEHYQNMGTGAARNAGIDNAQGKYIYFMDSDDEITADCISILYKKMTETPVDFIVASYRTIALDKDCPPTIYSDMLIPNSNHSVAIEYYKRRHPLIPVYLWNKLYDINFLKNNNIRCIPHQRAEDIFFTYQVILKAQSCRLLSNVTYIYYETIGSTTMEYRSVSSIRVAKSFEEITIAKIEYAHNFIKTSFYPIMMRQVFANAIAYATNVKNSKLPFEYRKDYVYKMINTTLQEIRLIYPFHVIPISLISRINDIKLKIILADIFNKIFLMRLFIKFYSLFKIKI